MAIKICLQNTQTINVMTAENTIAKKPLLKTYLRSFLKFPAPNFCATGMAKPLQTPIQKPIIIKFIDPVEPTEANALTPKYLPTIIVSTIL